MRSCPACDAEIGAADLRCPACNRNVALRVRLRSREVLRKRLEHLLQNRLVIPLGSSLAAGTTLRIRLALPENAGALDLAAQVVAAREVPSRRAAPYDVQLQLELKTAEREILRQAAAGESAPVDPAPQAAEPPASNVVTAPPPERGPTSGSSRPAPNTDFDESEVDARIEELLQCRAPPPAPAAAAAVPSPAEFEPTAGRRRLPEELTEDLTDFTVHFVRAVTKSAYYTAGHREAGRAKEGIYASFTKLLADRPEITFCTHTAGEKTSLLVYGVFDEPTPLAQAMLRSTSDIYVPKLCHYFDSNGLLSVSFKHGLAEDEFLGFVDLLASPAIVGPGGTSQIAQKLADQRIRNISVVVQEDRVSGRRLTWRVEMALTRLKKDLSLIPLYQQLGEEELKRVRLQVFIDVIRPLRQESLIRELLENCDLVVDAVDEFSQEHLAEVEAQILSSVSKELLPALLKALVTDIGEAKQEEGDRAERLLRLSRRVAQQLSGEEVGDLERAFRSLLELDVLALDELPAFLQEKIGIERNTDAFLKLKDPILKRFGQVAAPESYQRFLGLFHSILAELISRPDPSGAIHLLDCVSGHQTSPSPFEERPQLASAWLEQLVQSPVGAELARELTDADKVRREFLLILCRSVGEPMMPDLFQAFRKCENALARQALSALFEESKDSSLRMVTEVLQERDLPVEYLQNLLRILGRVGTRASASLASPFLQHTHPAVRIDALLSSCELDDTSAERRCSERLADPDAKVRAVAVKQLFRRRSTAPALFAFCGRVLGSPDESSEAIARLVCVELVGYDRGESREKALALLLGVLKDEANRDTRWWSSLKKSVLGDPPHLAVKIVACQALGRLGGEETVPALTRLSKHPTHALRQAAAHALKRIEDPEP